MLRVALRPSSLGLLALMLVFAVVCSLLGQWQLGRSREHARISPTETVVPIGDVLQPASDFTGHADHQRVSVSGAWGEQRLEYATGRSLDGVQGSWVVAPLEVDGTDGRPAGVLPVVLGWLRGGSLPPGQPTGRAEITGRLMVSEQAQGLGTGAAMTAVSSADLVNIWGSPIYTGYLVADAGSVAASGPGGDVMALPSPAPTPTLDLQNLSYAFQWWLFAVFALVLWGKIIRDRHRDELADAEAEAAEARADRAVSPTWEDGGVPHPDLTSESRVRPEVTS